MHLLFLLLIVLIAIPLFLMVIATAVLKRKWKNAWQQSPWGQKAASGTQNTKDPGRRQKKKIFDKNDGEYVAFEEISVETIEQQPDSANFDMRNCKRESQISDAEFEDL